ncbi:MAG: heme exporter protein CcmB [Myxococcales bacterium]|nr:heme exporter protein CcmB [Polyangiaceae bacterium]MDW8249215.1 heme exporter protein CcmB [Myxococcales bacterium]
MARSTRPPGWLGFTWLVLSKDLHIERKSGEIVTTSGFFALLVAVMASVAFSTGENRAAVAPGVIWISMAFASVLAISRSWHREREEGALTGLLVSPVPRGAIFTGKALGVTLFLFAVEGLVIPVAALLFALDLTRIGGGLLGIALAATPGVAASGTLFGAMTVRTQARDLVLASVLFPLLSPTLLAAVAATRELIVGAGLGELGDYFVLMAIFDLIFWAGGISLFGLLLEG